MDLLRLYADFFIASVSSFSLSSFSSERFREILSPSVLIIEEVLRFYFIAIFQGQFSHYSYKSILKSKTA